MSSDGGKGSSHRPSDVSDEVVADNWAKIFGKTPTQVIVDEYEDKITRNNEETQETKR